MEKYLSIVESALAEILPRDGARPSELTGAMRHGVGAGGKRLRPVICLASAVACGGKAEDARYPAAAIELLHNYTLVHDDLPAMDNDTVRRGKLSVWAKFGHANGILAGDALQALAFKTLSLTDERRPGNLAKMLSVLGASAYGVVAGQVEDLKAKVGSGVDALDYIFRHKTSDLFVAAAKMGALAGGGSDDDVAKLGEFALDLGMAFQFEDDLIDGDDGNFSSLSFYSADEVRGLVSDYSAKAKVALTGLPGDTVFLRDLVDKLVSRKV